MHSESALHDEPAACGRRSRSLTALRAALLAPALLSSVAGCIPELGAVDGATFGRSVRIRDPQLGRSASPGIIVRIAVDEHGPRPPAGVGRIVKRTFFNDMPPFLFNVSFACGEAGPDGKGTYTDPHSIWFNVFVGYYEIDVPKEKWKRPFGYRFEGDGMRIVLSDLLRIGKADWNYFSNYVYGVPLYAVQRHDSLEKGSGKYLGRVKVGDHEWDLIELEDVEVVSAYLSDEGGEGLADPDLISTPIWRRAFGPPHSQPDFPRSFIPTKMRAKLYMSYTEGSVPGTGEVMYRTTIFGGTTNDVYPDPKMNERFLEIQLEAVRRVMTNAYPNLGF